ncbi:hypothetical protein [Undibacterium sp. TJN19]|uniref:hypothetical protein n=1 Tax=Undibacterium sp. TJN19 TaxID=3413055 RepID=UPI003BF3E2CF
MKSKFPLKSASTFVLLLAMQLPGAAIFAAPAVNASTPSTTVKPGQGTQAVFVVAPEDLSKQGGVQIDTPRMAAPPKSSKPDIPIQVWSGPVPLSGGLFVLVASMPVVASLYFAYQLMLFIRTRRRRLSTERPG